MFDNGFLEKFINKTDDELLAIIENQNSDYSVEAIADAENLLLERGVAFSLPVIESSVSDAEGYLERQVENPIENSTVENSSAPFVVGVILVALSFFKPFITIFSYNDAALFNLIVNIVVRLISIIWIYNISSNYGLKKMRWFLLALIFGGWALIAINFAIWQKNED